MKESRRSLTAGTMILIALASIGFFVAVYRFIYGLGAITNLSDGRPWGFWISFDLYCGVALASGGFTMAAIFYIFCRRKYHDLVRPAIMTAFLGYILVVFALLIDLGQPWRIWHAIIFWNINSPLFEVAWCVMLYSSVLALEFSPAVFERLQWKVPLRLIRRIQIPLVIGGIVLSTGHQSSLGTMLTLMHDKVHPLWFSPMLPVHFFISALSVGLAMVIFEASLSAKAFNHDVDVNVLGGLGRMVPWVLGPYLIARVIDVIFRGNFGLAFTAFPQNLLWWLEILGGVVLPIVLFSMPGVRKSKSKLFWSALIVVLGLMLNRFNVSLFILEGRPGYSYWPHWMEIAISAGLFSAALLTMQLANRYLPVYHLGPTDDAA
ncbi:MAG: Ni/Fe-hydrogenase cytochrome b subunit [Deltaproteobacteria bacterium]|nr:Ni/Fe-hydrogenase cytochrome b subunit [Deltaproteobacteria bacterium]